MSARPRHGASRRLGVRWAGPSLACALALFPMCVSHINIGYYPLDPSRGNSLRVQLPWGPVECNVGKSGQNLEVQVGVLVPETPKERLHRERPFTMGSPPPRDYFWLNPPAAVFPELHGVTVSDNTQLPMGREYVWPAPLGQYEYRFRIELPCGDTIVHDRVIDLTPNQTIRLTVEATTYRITIEPSAPETIPAPTKKPASPGNP